MIFKIISGEIEFAELFSAESRENLDFQPVIIALVIIFLIVMSIVLINMLIGLAVDNISEIQGKIRFIMAFQANKGQLCQIRAKLVR